MGLQATEHYENSQQNPPCCGGGLVRGGGRVLIGGFLEEVTAEARVQGSAEVPGGGENSQERGPSRQKDRFGAGPVHAVVC